MIMDKPQTHCSNLWSKERGKGSSAKGSFPISINTKIQLIAVMVLTHVFQSVRFYVHCSLLFLQRHKMSLLVFFAIKINQFNINLQDVIVPMLSTRAGISHLLFSQVLKDLGSSLLLSGAHRWHCCASLATPNPACNSTASKVLPRSPKISEPELWVQEKRHARDTDTNNPFCEFLSAQSSQGGISCAVTALTLLKSILCSLRHNQGWIMRVLCLMTQRKGPGLFWKPGALPGPAPKMTPVLWDVLMFYWRWIINNSIVFHHLHYFPLFLHLPSQLLLGMPFPPPDCILFSPVESFHSNNHSFGAFKNTLFSPWIFC